MEKYNNYKKTQIEVLAAENWLSLKDSCDSQTGKKFKISLPHSVFKLTRCGQHNAGGNNYHESPEAFNKAMLVIIQNRYDELTQKALQFLRLKEKEALLALEEDIDNIKKEINEAKV